MAEPLPLPYATHPAFRFDGTGLDVPAADVAAFCAAYERLERGDLSAAQRRDVQLTAATLLGRLFDELRTDDADFMAFAADLRAHAQRLLAADLEHFAAQEQRSVSSDERLAALAHERFFFGVASRECLAALARITRDPLENLRRTAARGKVTREDLSINTGGVPAAIVRELDKEFERQGINDVVSAYMRRPMRVTGVALELSVPTAQWWRDPYKVGRAPRTLYAHTDEGLANPKSIVYLTDVDPTTGPMSLYPQCESKLALTPLQKLVGRVINSVGQTPGTRLHELYERSKDPRAFASHAFRRHFAMLPPELRYNSHFGWDVVPDSPLEHALVEAERPMLGPAGTFAVFDGARVIHRGGMVERGERVALQVVFSTPPSRLATLASAIARGKDTLGSSNLDLKSVRRRVGAIAQRFSRHPHDRLVRAVAKLLPPLACIDVGASYYPHPPWDVFRASPNTTWIAVEPNAQNTQYLDDWQWPSRALLVATGLSEHGGEQTLYVTNVDSGSSLLPPVITEDMKHRVADQSYFFPVTEKRIATKSLDELVVPDGPVFVKLDTQGTELAILRGGGRLLERTVGIETEATLLRTPVMVGSGKFWEVCQFLEGRGFELLQLKPIEGGTPRESALARRTYLNECDAVFCLSRSELAKRPPAFRRAALGFYLSYHLYDEARSLLDTLDGDTRHIRELLDS